LDHAVLRIFLDANVLFSAAYSEQSTPGLLFELAEACGAELVATAFVIEEARRNLALKRPGRLPHLARYVERIALVREPTRREVSDATPHGLPAKDVPVLAAAIRCRANLLVTGDRTHFGHLFGTTPGGVRVGTVAMGLRAMLREEAE
jgi:predicted nucleic acid-binding protein